MLFSERRFGRRICENSRETVKHTPKFSQYMLEIFVCWKPRIFMKSCCTVVKNRYEQNFVSLTYSNLFSNNGRLVAVHTGPPQPLRCLDRICSRVAGDGRNLWWFVLSSPFGHLCVAVGRRVRCRVRCSSLCFAGLERRKQHLSSITIFPFRCKSLLFRFAPLGRSWIASVAVSATWLRGSFAVAGTFLAPVWITAPH